ncbi:MAG: CRISPR-associated endonuclease Cas2 [Propionibacteriaceae bacterium]
MEKIPSGDKMWCLVMFDLPVKTQKQRAVANSFRELLLDKGFWRVQLSVYTRFAPLAGGSASAITAIKSNLPPGGEVRILHITDQQWATTFRFLNEEPTDPEEGPQQLTIF